MAVRRRVWEAYPFDESLTYGEDKEWGCRVTEASLKVILGIEATIHHVHPKRQFNTQLWHIYMTAQSQILYSHSPPPGNESRLMIRAGLGLRDRRPRH